MIDQGAAWCNQFPGPQPKKTFGVMFILCFTFNQPDLQIFCIKKKASAYSSRMKNRNVKCSFKGETNDFPSSGGGNHLDQSVLWHRDVIKLLMSLNEITCDPQRCHSIVSLLYAKSKWEEKKIKNCCSTRRKMWRRKHAGGAESWSN